MDTNSQQGQQKTPTGLPRYDDDRIHRRDWRAQRSAYAAFTGLILGAGVGVFGDGLLSTATHSGAGVVVEHERFARRTSPTELVVRIAQAGSDVTDIRLSRDFAQAVDFSHGGNLPLVHRSSGTDGVLQFATEPGKPAELHVMLQYRSAGRHRGEVVVDGQPFPIWTVVYP